MAVPKTLSLVLPAAAVAVELTRQGQMDASQRYIRNPLLDPVTASECDSLDNFQVGMAVGVAGSIGGMAWTVKNGASIVARSNKGETLVQPKAFSDDPMAVGLTGAISLLATTGFLTGLNHFNAHYYHKCMILNPNYSDRAAAVEPRTDVDNKGIFDKFAPIAAWLAAGSVFAGHQLAAGTVSAVGEGASAGGMTFGAAVSAGAVGLLAPFIVSLRSFVELHDSSSNVL